MPNIPFHRSQHMSVLVIVLVAAAGCDGASDAPETVPVTGTVKYNDAPVKNASITFSPLDSASARAAQTSADADGAFKTAEGKGLMVGKYKVIVQAYKVPLHEIPPAELATKGGDANLAVPKKYMDATTTDLTVEVTAGETSKELNLELKD